MPERVITAPLGDLLRQHITRICPLTDEQRGRVACLEHAADIGGDLDAFDLVRVAQYIETGNTDDDD